MYPNRLNLWTITGLSAGAFLALALIVSAPQSSRAEEPSKDLDPAQTEAIEKLVRDYLLKHPEVVVEALETFQQRQREAEDERRRAALVAEAAALNEDPLSPVLGNPEGDITVVEFFDYRCPYCRQVATALQDLVAEDPKVRLVMKEYPILGKDSVHAARAALAAVRQDQYERFHFALMERGGSMSETEVFGVAQSVGLDIQQLQQDMRSADVEEALRRNFSLADTIGVTGTPAMVIGTTMVPGAVSLERLRQLIAEARAQAS